MNLINRKNRKASSSGASTYVGPEMIIDGKVKSLSSIRIDGEIKGSIDCKSEVAIGTTANVSAVIHAARIVVNGKVDGDLFATDEIEVLGVGHIKGNITNPPGKLMIHQGAVIEGQCLTYSESSVKNHNNLTNANSSNKLKNVTNTLKDNALKNLNPATK